LQAGSESRVAIPSENRVPTGFFPKSVTGVSDALNMKLTPDP